MEYSNLFILNNFKLIRLPKNARLLDAEFNTDRSKNIPFSCKKGSCGLCIIKIKNADNKSMLINNKSEKEITTLNRLGYFGKSYRLACNCKFEGNLVINVINDEKVSQMKNRVRNIGYDLVQSKFTPTELTSIRTGIDIYIEEKIKEWYETVPYANHFETKDLNKKYYIRHLIETALRIRILRVSEAKALVELAKIQPEAAQVWAKYECDEMLHDELFIKDLEKAGVTREEFLTYEPYLSTKLLTGYFSYLLDHEGPLGVIVYSYLVEYVNVKIEKNKLEVMKKTLGEDNILGQIMHAEVDSEDDHPGEVWDCLKYLIKNDEDVEKIKRYIDENQYILSLYFKEIYADIIKS